MFIFLDESGDLGFDPDKPRSSKSFTITLLVCHDRKTLNAIKAAVKHTLRNKLNKKKGKRRIVHELKGSATSPEVKSYFLRKMPAKGWKLYAISLNKARVYPQLKTKAGKKKLYNFLTKELLMTLRADDGKTQTVNLVVDRCKDSEDRKDFNAYIQANLETAFPLETAVYVTHEDSQANAGLQAVDMFCWGIQRKENDGEGAWYKQYSGHIAHLVHYLPEKKKGACAA